MESIIRRQRMAHIGQILAFPECLCGSIACTAKNMTSAETWAAPVDNGFTHMMAFQVFLASIAEPELQN
jgi:hypothetical protein